MADAVAVVLDSLAARGHEPRLKGMTASGALRRVGRATDAALAPHGDERRHPGLSKERGSRPRHSLRAEAGRPALHREGERDVGSAARRAEHRRQRGPARADSTASAQTARCPSKRGRRRLREGAALSEVKILDGNTFVVSDDRGDIEASPIDATGLFSFDTRFLSTWVLSVNGERLNALSVDDLQYFETRFFLVPGTGPSMPTRSCP